MIKKYKYLITYNFAITEVYPLFDGDPEIKHDHVEGLILLLKKFSAKLVFTNKNGSPDYDFFLDIETNDKCALIQLDVQQYCAGSYNSIITSEFGVVDGEWDKDNCTFSVQPNPNGLYACLLSKTKVNIVDVPQTITMDAPVTSGAVPTFLLSSFEDVLLYVAQQTCSGVTGIVSDFFQINPITPSAINYITGMNNVYTKMGMTSLSNIRNPVPSNPATVELTTFKDLTDDLLSLFFVSWVVDNSGVIRIEHYNFFNSAPGLDLTLSQYDIYMSGTNKYKYSRSDSPKYENWTMNNSDQECEITYDNACGNSQVNEDRITYNVKTIFTDFYTAWLESNKLAGNTRGIFLFATDGVPNGLGNWTMLGTNENSELVLGRLVLKFFRWGRPQLNGTFKFIPKIGDFTFADYGDLFIYSERATKEQIEFKIKFCCSDVFNSDEVVSTFMGSKGIVSSATQNLVDDTLTLNLKYKINSDNADTTPNTISGLQVWLKGDTGKAVALGKVYGWADQSGNGNDFEQLYAPDQPTNNSTYLQFNGSMMFSSSAIQTFPSKRGSVFIVSENFDFLTPSGGGNDATLLAIDAANKWDISFKYFFDAGAGDAWKYHSFSETIDYPENGFMSGIKYYYYGWLGKLLFELIRDNDTTQKTWLNGKQSLLNPMTISNIQVSSDQLIIGGNGAVTNRYAGNIYEIIIYDRDLNDIERQKVEQYLAKKYAINLYSVS